MNRTYLFLAACAASILSSPTPVFSSTDATIEEIVVTAQRRSESIQDVPISITAHTGEHLENAGISDVMELAAVTPGFVVIESSSAAAPYIRGVGGRILTPGNESTMAFYLDGVYQTDKTGILLSSFEDIESVQVLRGPQGTLFGRNATAGAMLVTTQKPQQEFTARVRATAGSDETGYQLFLSGGLSDTVSVSLSAFQRDEDDYIDNLNPGNGLGSEVGEQEAEGVRLKLLWEPSDDFSALLEGNYHDSRAEASMSWQFVEGTGLTLAEGIALGAGFSIPDVRNNKRAYAGEAPPESRSRGDGISLTLNWSTDRFDIQSITAYREDNAGVQLDLDSSPIPVFWFDTDLDSEVFQQEFTIASTGDGPFSWIGGIYYIDYDDGYNRLDQNVSLPVPNPLFAGAFDPAALGTHIEQPSYVNVESLGIFGEFSYQFTDASRATLGVRYTDEEATLDLDKNVRTVFVSDGAGGALTFTTLQRDLCNADPACDGSTEFDEVTWRLVVAHDFSDDMMGYASYNRGFKSGVYNISSLTNISATEPEIIDAYEIGIKGIFLNGALQLNGVMYYSEYQELQVPIVDPATNTQISLNAAAATTSGLELEATWLVNENFQLQATAATYFESEFDSFANCQLLAPQAAGNANVSGECSGEDLPNTPDVTFSLAASYAIPLDSSGRVEINGLYSYTDEFDHIYHGTYDATNLGLGAGEARGPIQDDFSMVNLSVRWVSADDRYSVEAWGKNLLDEDIFNSVTPLPFGWMATFNRGDTYGVTLGYRY